MDVRVRLWRRLSAEELKLLNCECWRRVLRVPWTAGRSNQSILKEISPGCSLEGMMLKLKLQYFGHLMLRVDSLETTLMLGEIGGRRRRDDRGWDGFMASPTRWMWVWVTSGSWWWTGRPGVLRFMGSQRVGHNWATELNWLLCFCFLFHWVLPWRGLRHATQIRHPDILSILNGRVWGKGRSRNLLPSKPFFPESRRAVRGTSLLQEGGDLVKLTPGF